MYVAMSTDKQWCVHHHDLFSRSQVFVDIQLADANDNTPIFLNEPYSANINEVNPKPTKSSSTTYIPF